MYYTVYSRLTATRLSTIFDFSPKIGGTEFICYIISRKKPTAIRHPIWQNLSFFASINNYSIFRQVILPSKIRNTRLNQTRQCTCVNTLYND